MDIKGLIFDLDGVIVHTDQYHYQAWKKLADRLGIYFDEDINNRLRGISRMESLDIILENYHGNTLSIQDKEKLTDEKNTYYRSLLETMTSDHVPDVVKSTLAELKNRGFKLAIGSSSKNAKLILNKVGLLNYFDAISDGTNITYSKPNPEVFIKAAQDLRLSTQECAVIEDANAGIDAAKRAEMLAIAIGPATTYEKSDLKLQKFVDLLDIFIELC